MRGFARRLERVMFSLRARDILTFYSETLNCLKCECEKFRALKLKFEDEQENLSWYESYKRVLWNSDNLGLILFLGNLKVALLKFLVGGMRDDCKERLCRSLSKSLYNPSWANGCNCEMIMGNKARSTYTLTAFALPDLIENLEVYLFKIHPTQNSLLLRLQNHSYTK